MPTLPIAAVIYRPDDPLEALLANVARSLAARGVRLGGVIQHALPALGGQACGMQLENLETGECFGLSQNLGAGSVACRLDADALARGAMAVRAAVEHRVELVIINKFGAQEAAGAGLRDDMAQAVAAGVPVLTAVAERFAADWMAFAGDDCALLPPRLDAVLAWWDRLQTEG
ncbi:MAG: DUF2478 domain-containing protein [Thauera sp.]|nr:DUF2478 domain-containing protein [Thauera sp.]